MWAQVDQPLDGWGELVATYGPFAPFAMFTLTVIAVLWRAYLGKDVEVKRLTDAATEKMIPLVLRATDVLTDAVTAMKEGRMAAAHAAELLHEMQAFRDDVRDLRAVMARKR